MSAFLKQKRLDRFEENKPDGIRNNFIFMISGCEDEQTSADVPNVEDFQLPDPAGRAGGACTSAFLSVMYNDHQANQDGLTYAEVLELMREDLKQKEFTQNPQLTASGQIDVYTPFQFVPEGSTGTRRALMIGINYIGTQSELSGCHSDVLNMKEYIQDVHGFQDEDITILMDDEPGEYPRPTFENIVNAFRQLVEVSQPGDAVFCHYSGHGAQVKDPRSTEADGADECLCPVDYQEKGLLADIDIFDLLIKPMASDVYCLFIMDCCHSGTILNLPYTFRAGGEYDQMNIPKTFNFNRFFGRFGQNASDAIGDDDDDDDDDEEEQAEEEAEEEAEEYAEEEEEGYSARAVRR